MKLLVELIDIFIQDNGERLKQWENICKNRDATTLLQEVHYLAGSSLNLGLLRLGTLCQNIEKAIKSQKFDAYDSCYDVAQKEYNLAVNVLCNYVQKK